MRIGVFGGTFDPVHMGHLILAEQCREQVKLDQVLFIPAARPPHKRETPLTRFEQRVEMLELALAGQPAFRVDELEKDRAGPSYTADTLALLKERQAGTNLFLILGADAVFDLPLWYQPHRILELATLVAVPRPGWNAPNAEEVRQALGAEAAAQLRYVSCTAPLIEISSRDLRKRVAEGRSIRYMTPRAVEAYIQEKKLYLDQ